MKKFLRDNGLTIALMALFAASMLGMIVAGQASYNQELRDHGSGPVGLATYLATGDFLSALFENWESEFLQMSAYVVLTAILFQRGSAELRDPDDPIRPGDVMTSSRLRPWLAWAYQHSLGMVLALLFVVSFMLHVVFSVDAANERAALHGAAPAGLFAHLMDAQLWFESFQNWQSEFLSTAVLVVLSIFLRHKGSPESKALAADHGDTGA